MRVKGTIVCGAAVAAVLAVAGALYLFRPNDLGLTAFDTLLGKRSEMEMLRTNIQAAANAFLAKRKQELTAPALETFDLVVDYSKAAKIRSLSYRSSFYYYCWNIYIPYCMRTASGQEATVVVQVSDGTPGHGHDPHHFHVVRVILLDRANRITKTLDGEEPTIRLQATARLRLHSISTSRPRRVRGETSSGRRRAI